MRFVNLLQSFLDNMGIDLRRRNIAMAKHQLDRAQIRAAFQKMGGKTVPEHVRREGHAQSSLAPIGRKDLPDTNAT